VAVGALHKIESEEVGNAVLQFANGATGVIQASDAFGAGVSPSATEFHGTKGSAIISGDKSPPGMCRTIGRRNPPC